MCFAIKLINKFYEQNLKSEPMLGALVMKHNFASCVVQILNVIADYEP